MTFPYTKASIWLLFTLLGSMSLLFGQPPGNSGRYAVTMTESGGPGPLGNYVFYPSLADCLDDSYGNGLVSVDVIANLNLSISAPPDGTAFALKLSIAAVTQTGSNSVTLDPVSLMAPYTTPQYVYTSVEYSLNHQVQNLTASIHFYLLEQCEYVITGEVYYLPSTTNNDYGIIDPQEMIIYEPGEFALTRFILTGLIVCDEDCIPSNIGNNTNLDYGGADRLSQSNTELVVSSLYPNPTSSISTLTFTSSSLTTIDILDLQGRIVSPTALTQPFEAGSHRIKLPLHHLAPGIYFVRLQSGGVFKTQKLIIVD